MAKRITKIVLTGGPAAGKTTLVSRVLKEFKQEDGWRVITIPETATELISGFGIKPFDNCMSMLQFQDFVVGDQIHKEKLALDAAQLVPEDNILILYDRALMDDKAYVSDEEFAQVIARFDGRTEERVLANYDMVLHLITCAKGAEFAYDLGNNARTESIEFAREMDAHCVHGARTRICASSTTTQISTIKSSAPCAKFTAPWARSSQWHKSASTLSPCPTWRRFPTNTAPLPST